MEENRDKRETLVVFHSKCTRTQAREQGDRLWLCLAISAGLVVAMILCVGVIFGLRKDVRRDIADGRRTLYVFLPRRPSLEHPLSACGRLALCLCLDTVRIYEKVGYLRIIFTVPAG